MKATPWTMTGASGTAGRADPHPATIKAAAVTASPAAAPRFFMPI
ncbi:MAG: hypothetical protein ACRDPY_03360 [Streptosporangiaceae bacterium]